MRQSRGFLFAALFIVLLETSYMPYASAFPGDDPQKPAIFKTQATLVQVPAVITDKNGKHIHGLTKGDFQILEDGTEQKITVFEEIHTSDAPPKAFVNQPNAFTNLIFSGDPQCVLSLVVFDAINTAFMDQQAGRLALIKYLNDHPNSKPSMGLMLMTDNGIKKLSGMTDDTAALIKTLENLKGETPATEAFAVSPQRFSSSPERLRLEKEAEITEATNRQEQAIDRTMRSFLAIALSLSGVPGRKSLIWATGSFPFYLDSMKSEPENPRLAQLYERTMEALNDAQISVYPVDVRGLASNATVDSKSNAAKDILEKTMAQTRLLDSTLHNLQSFADLTGGRAFYNRNDLDSGFRDAVEDSSSYYLLGYYRNTQNMKPGWRKLQVKLQREDAEIRAREGFYVGHATLDPASTQQADETFALMSPFDSTGIPLMVRWNGEALTSGKTPEFAMLVPASNVIETTDAHRVNLDFIWEASRNGASVLKDGHSLKGNVNEPALEKLKRDGVYYKNSLKLPRGDYQVKFVVRDNLSGRIGSVTTPLTVP